MFENSEIWNLNTLCRCCHKDGNFKSLEDSFLHQNKVEVYGQMLRDTFNIFIQQPLLEASNTICEECIVRLRDACNFKKQVQDCERKFGVYCKNELGTSANEPIKTELDSDNDKSMDCNIDGYEIEIECAKLQDLPKKEWQDFIDIKSIKSEKPVVSIKADVVPKIKTDSRGKEQKKPVRKTTKRIKKNIQYDSSLEIHVKTETGILYSCKICGGSYTQHKDIKHHIITTHIPRYECKKCNEKFTTITDLTDHRKTHNNDVFVCDYCYKAFKKKFALRIHVNKHTKSENFICDICSKRFAYKATLYVHMKLHNGINGTKKRWVCDICGKAFNHKCNLRSHIDTVHEKKRPFACDMCPKTLTSKKHLKTHIRNHNEFPFQCKDCPKKYNERNELNVHIKSAHSNSLNKYVCSVCGKCWCDKSKYSMHIRKAHKGYRPHKCPVCQKVFSGKYSMKRHVTEHSGVRPWQCDQCDDRFFQKSALKRHTERKHVSEKPKILDIVKEKCEVCNKNVPDIKKHMICHTNIKFSCEYCGKGFSENNTLTRHKKIVHLKMKPHPCQLCDEKYVKISGLRNHQMKVHKIVSKDGNEDFDSAVTKFSRKNGKGRIKTESGCDG